MMMNRKHSTMRSVLSAIGRPALILLIGLAGPALAMADGDADVGVPRLGLDPGEPQSPSPPPSVPFGVHPAESKEYVLDFHGYLLLPAYLGLHEREDPAPGQSSLVLHSPPLVPQNLRDFQYTGVVPSPWLQLNFIYGNSTVSATVIVAGTSAIDAAGYYDPVAQMGVNDAYLTVNLTKWLNIPLQVNVGALTGRYGAMGGYDAGRYGTPLIAQTNTIGETITGSLELRGDLFLMFEQGLGGQTGRPPIGLVPAGWNDFVASHVERARGYFATGYEVLQYIPRRPAACVHTMAGIYEELLKKIERDPGLPLRERAALSKTEKLRVVVRSWLSSSG